MQVLVADYIARANSQSVAFACSHLLGFHTTKSSLVSAQWIFLIGFAVQLERYSKIQTSIVSDLHVF